MTLLFTPDLIVDHTYFVPTFSHNLLSAGQLCELGLYLYFFNSGCIIQDPQMGNINGTGHKVGHLFELESLHVPPWSVVVASSSSHVSLSLWHSRLGHACFSKLQN